MDQLFKIIFEGDLKDTTSDDLVFTFISLPIGSRLILKSNYIKQLIKLCEENEQYYLESNIKDAFTTGGKLLRDLFTNYYVIFYTNTRTNKKRGFIISVDGSGAGNGDKKSNRNGSVQWQKILVNAAWPMSFRDVAVINSLEFKKEIQDLIIHPEQFENVNIFTEI
ncbi:MAG: hypothetical protein ACTSWN_02815 [Promethearchaeota archaeon]